MDLLWAPKNGFSSRSAGTHVVFGLKSSFVFRCGCYGEGGMGGWCSKKMTGTWVVGQNSIGVVQEIHGGRSEWNRFGGNKIYCSCWAASPSEWSFNMNQDRHARLGRLFFILCSSEGCSVLETFWPPFQNNFVGIFFVKIAFLSCSQMSQWRIAGI